jgi:hypothetical protein
MSTTEETAEAGHSFQTQVGSLPDPGQESRCAECGKTYRQHAVIRLPWETVPADEAGAVARPCGCGPDDSCFDCATDEEAAAAIPPWPSMGGAA